MRTIIYVDGFNFYFGALKHTSYRWLDLNALFINLLNDENEIITIKYFTARVKSLPYNQAAPDRQDAYLRALKAHIPHIEIFEATFSKKNKYMRLTESPDKSVEVIKTDEKGSDVNLAVHLLNDAYQNKYDCAVVVSNDSDMTEAMRLVREHHKEKIIGLITPGEERTTSRKLADYAHFIRKTRRSALEASQLPDKIPNSNIRKPDRWYDI